MSAINRQAARQKGHVTRAQLRAWSVSDDQLYRMCKFEGWVEVLPRIYRLPGTPDTWENKLVATGLWLGGRGHFFGPTAAYILRLDGIDRPSEIEVALYTGVAPEGLRGRRLLPQDRPPTRSVNGCRVPRVERVLLDLAATSTPKIVGLALDDALRRSLTTIDRLQAFLADHAGRRGMKTLTKLVSGRDPRDEKVRSVMETKMLRILKRIEGFEIIPNYKVIIDGHTYFIDFYLSAVCLGIECHSRRWHDTESSGRDIRRDRRIRSTGIELLYYDWDDVTFQAEGTEAEIRAAVARRLRAAR